MVLDLPIRLSFTVSFWMEFRPCLEMSIFLLEATTVVFTLLRLQGRAAGGAGRVRAQQRAARRAGKHQAGPPRAGARVCGGDRRGWGPAGSTSPGQARPGRGRQPFGLAPAPSCLQAPAQASDWRLAAPAGLQPPRGPDARAKLQLRAGKGGLHGCYLLLDGLAGARGECTAARVRLGAG